MVLPSVLSGLQSQVPLLGLGALGVLGTRVHPAIYQPAQWNSAKIIISK